jgi:hypothetical protein
MIYLTTRNIEIKSPVIYCDLCHRTLSLFAELDEARLRRIPPERTGWSPEGLFVIDGLPITELEMFHAASERGWKRELVHGKTLDICPSCSDNQK